MAWVLELTRPSADPTLRVAGLPLALRLALDAQAGGAEAIVVGQAAVGARAVLLDARLKLPVIDSIEVATRVVRVPASFVVHRALFRKIQDHDAALEAPPPVRDLAEEPFPHGAVYGFDPIDVIDPKTHEAAERALFRALRKPEDGWTSRYLNRYLSLFLSRWLVRTNLRPNQISVGILGIGLTGAFLAATAGEAGLVWGAALLQTQSVLDGCDGEMSRVTYRGSRLGEWLDTIGDDLSNYGFFAGAAYGLYRLSGSLPYLGAGAVTVLCGIIASGLEYRYLIRIGSGDLLKYPLSQRQNTGAFSHIAPLFKRDTFVFITLIATLLGWLGPMLVVFAAGGIGILWSVIKTELRLSREARS